MVYTQNIIHSQGRDRRALSRTKTRPRAFYPNRKAGFPTAARLLKSVGRTAGDLGRRHHFIQLELRGICPTSALSYATYIGISPMI